MEQTYAQERFEIQSIKNYYLDCVAKSSPYLYPQILRIKINEPVFGNKIAFLNTGLMGTA